MLNVMCSCACKHADPDMVAYIGRDIIGKGSKKGKMAELLPMKVYLSGMVHKPVG